MKIPFTKMNGTGNDFVILDNRNLIIDSGQKREFVKKVCARKTSVGADGVIFIENSDKANFSWDFYNSDGSTAEMCGNGARCVARYAYEHDIAPIQLSFETLAGIITAKVDGPIVKVKLPIPNHFRENLKVKLEHASYDVDSLNTGVPHAVVFSQDVSNEDVQPIGRSIRFHQKFAPAGTNVNFAQVKDSHSLIVRTYERGIEDETLACGTGAVASAILASLKNKVQPPVQVETRGGEMLKVHFHKPDNGTFSDVFLEGITKNSFEGVIFEL